jgi:hypothetical protein
MKTDTSTREGQSGPVTHNGETYPSLYAAAVAHGLSGATVINRVRRGWSIADALSAPPKSPGKTVRIGDTTYASKRDACAAAGVDPWTIHDRVKKGMTFADAIALGKRRRGPVGKPVEWNGQRFASAAELARAMGLDPHAVRARIKLGWQPGRAVSEPVRPYRPRQSTKP